jgi:ribose 5-phosphate isomerase B
MKIAIASDHAGFELKEEVRAYLNDALGFEVVDLGTNSTESVDYPDLAHKLAATISNKEVEFAVLVCGSGIGMCMAANRHEHVRAAVLRESYDAEMSRLHNNANVACLGARVTPPETAKELLALWFKTDFEGGRHERRVNKIERNL